VFGTIGHRGTSLNSTFTGAHVLAITQAICDYRKAQGITGILTALHSWAKWESWHFPWIPEFSLRRASIHAHIEALPLGWAHRIQVGSWKINQTNAFN
jgi:hypothetical protein